MLKNVHLDIYCTLFGVDLDEEQAVLVFDCN